MVGRGWVAAAVAIAWVGVVAATATAATGGVPPVPGAVVGSFDPPEVPWGSGHRGVDVAAAPGAAVVAPADGVVSFAGLVAGRPVLVVSHGDTRSTLEPVVATVAVGTVVTAGQPVGVLEAGHGCAAASCLHWGLLRGEEYLDPLGLLAGGQVRLLPDGAVAGIRQRATAREAAARAAASGSAASGTLLRPVAVGIGSAFGLRFHPIFHEWRLHAGVDLSAPCGTPIRAAADGVVTHVGFDASGGWRLVLDHGDVGGSALVTSYLHAQGYGVRRGQRVARGEVVGTVGSTGWSTGCHLHFGTRVAGRVVDPAPWIGG